MVVVVVVVVVVVSLQIGAVVTMRVSMWPPAGNDRSPAG
jgi:hypothetical protein